MQSNVIPLGNVTRLDVPVDRVLDMAKGKCPNGVIIMGYDEDGQEYFASSIADGGTVLWLLERLKQQLIADDE